MQFDIFSEAEQHSFFYCRRYCYFKDLYADIFLYSQFYWLDKNKYLGNFAIYYEIDVRLGD